MRYNEQDLNALKNEFKEEKKLNRKAQKLDSSIEHLTKAVLEKELHMTKAKLRECVAYLEHQCQQEEVREHNTRGELRSYHEGKKEGIRETINYLKETFKL